MNTLVWTYHRVLPEASPGVVGAEHSCPDVVDVRETADVRIQMVRSGGIAAFFIGMGVLDGAEAENPQ